jgi:D-alanyl-D-alanine carboxypeptidase (penicillin-binding protein 5/6)
MKKFIGICLVMILCFPVTVFAKEEQGKIQSEYYVLMEADSGKVLLSKNEEAVRSPASITKIMTVLLIFENLEQKKLSLTDMVVTSAHAKSMGGSQVFLEEGEEQSVETLLKCILIASGNDASVAMAERIGGTEENFVRMMNEKAKTLGMKQTHFVDCCGLTDSDEHHTSAKDVATVTRELITKYPQVLEYSSIWMETIVHKTKQGEKEFVLSNTNKLLKTSDCVKGLKTGSTSKAKYCVSNVAQKNGVTLISVVMAAPDYKARFHDSYQLIQYGFSKCRLYGDEKTRKEYPINGGEKKTIVGEKQPAHYVDTDGIDFGMIEKKECVKKELQAPIQKGDFLGVVEYRYQGKTIYKANLVATTSVEQADFLYNMKKTAEKLLQIA